MSTVYYFRKSGRRGRPRSVQCSSSCRRSRNFRPPLTSSKDTEPRVEQSRNHKKNCAIERITSAIKSTKKAKRVLKCVVCGKLSELARKCMYKYMNDEKPCSNFGGPRGSLSRQCQQLLPSTSPNKNTGAAAAYSKCQTSKAGYAKNSVK